MRVHELSKKLKISNKELLEYLNTEFGSEYSSVFCEVTDFDTSKAMNKFGELDYEQARKEIYSTFKDLKGVEIKESNGKIEVDMFGISALVVKEDEKGGVNLTSNLLSVLADHTNVIPEIKKAFGTKEEDK